MKAKPITPYKRLLDEIIEYERVTLWPRKENMFFIAKARLNAGHMLLDVYERTLAANQLGYDVKIDAREDGLHFIYTKRFSDHQFRDRG